MVKEFLIVVAAIAGAILSIPVIGVISSSLSLLGLDGPFNCGYRVQTETPIFYCFGYGFATILIIGLLSVPVTAFYLLMKEWYNKKVKECTPKKRKK